MKVKVIKDYGSFGVRESYEEISTLEELAEYMELNKLARAKAFNGQIIVCIEVI